MQALTHSFIASAILLAVQVQATELTLNTETASNTTYSAAVTTNDSNSAKLQSETSSNATFGASEAPATNTDDINDDAATDVLVDTSNQTRHSVTAGLDTATEALASLPEQATVIAQQTVSTALSTAATNSVQQQLTSSVANTVSNSVQAEVAQALQQNIRLSLPGVGN